MSFKIRLYISISIGYNFINSKNSQRKAFGKSWWNSDSSIQTGPLSSYICEGFLASTPGASVSTPPWLTGWGRVGEWVTASTVPPSNPDPLTTDNGRLHIITVPPHGQWKRSFMRQFHFPFTYSVYTPPTFTAQKY